MTFDQIVLEVRLRARRLASEDIQNAQHDSILSAGRDRFAPKFSDEDKQKLRDEYERESLDRLKTFLIHAAFDNGPWNWQGGSIAHNARKL